MLDLNEMLSVKQVSKILHIDVNTVRSWVHKGILPCGYKSPTNRMFFFKEDVYGLLERGSKPRMEVEKDDEKIN